MLRSPKPLFALASVLLLLGFFLTWVDFFFIQASAWDFTFGRLHRDHTPLMWYLPVLLPLSGGAILLALGTGSSEAVNILRWVPLSALVLFLINVFTGGERASISDVLRAFGIGFWLSLAASLLLALFRLPTTAAVRPEKAGQ